MHYPCSKNKGADQLSGLQSAKSRFSHDAAHIVLLFFVFQVPSQFVENMLDIHGKYTELIASVFRNDQQFVGALDKVCMACSYISMLLQPVVFLCSKSFVENQFLQKSKILWMSTSIFPKVPLTK